MLQVNAFKPATGVTDITVRCRWLMHKVALVGIAALQRKASASATSAVKRIRRNVLAAASLRILK